MTAAPAPMPSGEEGEASGDLRRIQDVAHRVGLTPRAIRYYEGLGLIKPSARSAGDFRLFSAEDVERLQRIKALRDDAGFSLADIGRYLADEMALAEVKAAYRQASDTAERRRLAAEGLARLEARVELLRAKIERLAAMVGEAEARRGRVLALLSELDASVKAERA
ncbi:MAG: MerR family transcriptional regulator [Candidatus Limnocylindrales bacterium]